MKIAMMRRSQVRTSPQPRRVMPPLSLLPAMMRKRKRKASRKLRTTAPLLMRMKTRESSSLETLLSLPQKVQSVVPLANSERLPTSSFLRAPTADPRVSPSLSSLLTRKPTRLALP